MKCVITGCALVTGDGWLAGDLFDTGGDDWVFSGNWDHRRSLPEWQRGEPVYVRVLQPEDWWERRGVFVIPKRCAGANDAAREYIARAAVQDFAVAAAKRG